MGSNVLALHGLELLNLWAKADTTKKSYTFDAEAINSYLESAPRDATTLPIKAGL
jgi:hypothetical protein